MFLFKSDYFIFCLILVFNKVQLVNNVFIIMIYYPNNNMLNLYYSLYFNKCFYTKSMVLVTFFKKKSHFLENTSHFSHFLKL